MHMIPINLSVVVFISRSPFGRGHLPQGRRTLARRAGPGSISALSTSLVFPAHAGVGG
jgi:hypothetical protein